jgi:hypothetical protein
MAIIFKAHKWKFNNGILLFHSVYNLFFKTSTAEKEVEL